MFFCSTWMFWFQNKLKKHIFLMKRGGCKKTFFCYQPVFCKMWKVIVFLFAPFLPNIGWCSKTHYKNRDFGTLKKQKIKKHFEVLLSGPSSCYYLGQVDCNLKMANLAQIITPQICALFQKMCWNPYFIVFFDKQCFVKSKLGPDNNTSKGLKKPNLAQIITPQLIYTQIWETDIERG